MADVITLKKSSGGVLLKNSDGVLVKECGGDPCQYCDGSTPKTFEVAVSGVSGGCCKTGEPFYRPDIDTTLAIAWVHGTHTLEQTGPCTWSKTSNGVWYQTFYRESGCSVSPAGEASAWLTWILEKTSATTWTLRANFETAIYIVGKNLWGVAFYSEITGQAENCSGDLEFPSSLTDCAFRNVMCTGGVATVSVP